MRPGIVIGNTVEALKHAAPVVAVGSFWGGALKRLNAATAAVAVARGGGPPLTRDLGENQRAPSLAANDSLNSTTSTEPPPLVPLALLPNSSAPPTAIPPRPATPPLLSVNELKKVRFRMATLQVVYPINGPNGPLAPWEEGKTKKRYVRSQTCGNRKRAHLVLGNRINEEYRALQQKSLEGGESRGWTGEKLARLYAECCRTREEPGIERVQKALKVRIQVSYRSLLGGRN